MASSRLFLSEEEMIVDEGLGYPLAYAKVCRNVTHFNLYSTGPPLDFMPRYLSSQEVGKAKDLNMLFPVVDHEGTPSVDPHGFVNLLWKQLAHLGNAGFDPVLFRVDQYGNVLYFHADPASPLYWSIDHWFPCSRGGKTVPSNLRILQRQVFRKKHNKLEFLIPWWDLQLGISVNQFLSMFASRNSDFRNRAFSFLFKEGGNEKLNEGNVVDSHTFPHHFGGLAPDAIVASQRHQLRPLKMKRRPSLGEDDHEDLTRSIQRFKRRQSKENDDPNININSSQSNAYISIALATNSLKEREEDKKIQAEMIELENELDVLNHSNDSERIVLQDLEVRLIKKRRRVEKCRRLAESQSSYKALLEKMIRDAMHQTVVYKEQVRLNQAANNALMATLEAQRAICDASEKDLYKKYKQGDEIKKQIDEPYSEQGRKRSRIDEIVDDNCSEKMDAVLYVKQDEEVDAILDLKQKERIDAMFNERHDLIARSILASTISSVKPAIKKELRQFLEEEQKASEVGTSVGDEEEIAEELLNTRTHSKNEGFVDDKLKKPPYVFGSCSEIGLRKTVSVPSSPNFKLDEALRAKHGKSNMEQWVKILLKNAKDDSSLSESSPNRSRNANQSTKDIVHKLNLTNPQKEIKILKLKPSEESGGTFKERPSFKCHELQTRESSSNLFESGGTFKEDMGETTSVKNNKERLKKKSSSKASTSSACDDIGVKSVEWNEMEWKRGRNFRPFPSPSVRIKRGMDCVKRPHAICELNTTSISKNHFQDQ